MAAAHTLLSGRCHDMPRHQRWYVATGTLCCALPAHDRCWRDCSIIDVQVYFDHGQDSRHNSQPDLLGRFRAIAFDIMVAEEQDETVHPNNECQMSLVCETFVGAFTLSRRQEETQALADRPRSFDQKGKAGTKQGPITYSSEFLLLTLTTDVLSSLKHW